MAFICSTVFIIDIIDNPYIYLLVNTHTHKYNYSSAFPLQELWDNFTGLGPFQGRHWKPPYSTYWEKDAVWLNWTHKQKNPTCRPHPGCGKPKIYKNNQRRHKCMGFWRQNSSAQNKPSSVCAQLLAYLHDKNCCFWITEFIQCL